MVHLLLYRWIIDEAIVFPGDGFSRRRYRLIDLFSDDNQTRLLWGNFTLA
jgi:hypothetical protein